LKNPRSGKFLVEDYSVAVAPSASLYARQLEYKSETNHKNWTVLAVSDSAQEKDLALSHISYEASKIAQLFPGSDLISADRGNSLPWPESLFRHEVVHFYGHWGASYPKYDRSFSVTNLPVREKTRLVVLAACNTLTGILQRKEHGFGLAAPLLSRGVPAVMATSWDVEDFASSRLLVQFYRHLRAGKDGANALRAAQLDLLHGKDERLRAPSKWAGFQFLGFGGI
jgi:CHAT domain-containing protein